MLANLPLVRVQVLVAAQALPLVGTGNTRVVSVVLVFEEHAVQPADFLLQVHEGLFGVVLVCFLVHEEVYFVESVPDFDDLLLAVRLAVQLLLQVSDQSQQVRPQILHLATEVLFERLHFLVVHSSHCFALAILCSVESFLSFLFRLAFGTLGVQGLVKLNVLSQVL
jgi:hypothetical protein